MGLDATALFEEQPQPKRTIEKEYNYKDEAGTLLFQAIRFSPKSFSQRRPDGQGGWIYNLQGIRRVVYRLPELKGRQAAIWTEGEKDADAAWALGVPATCNPMGAGKWDPSYANQVRAQGIQRVAVIPDNDDVGRSHAFAVASGLQQAGLEVRVVALPGLSEHGDLSDYLSAGKTKDDLLGLIRSVSIGLPAPPVVSKPPKEFVALGDRRYRLMLNTHGVTLDVDHVRRDREGITGELAVRVNGYFPHAKSFKDGIISIGDFNFASVQARSTRAKILSERAGDKDFDWFGLLEEFVVEVITHERTGAPPIVLGSDSDVPEQDDPVETWNIDGFPVLIDDAMVLFGDSASGKSYLALWIAGRLAELGIKVLYVDWEFSEREHRKRLRRLFQPTPKNLLYIRSDAPLCKETNRISRLIQDHGFQYLVCDSIGFAVDGPAETHEAAKNYFSALRYLGLGSLNLAHIAKARDDNRDATIYGSAFFRAGARSAWFVDRATENAQGELSIGLQHRKSNSSDLLKPLAFKFLFTKHRVNVERADINKVDALASQLPLLERLKRHMKDGEFYAYKDLADDLCVGVDAIRKATNRSKSFNKLNRKVRYVQHQDPDDAEPPKVVYHDF